MSPASLRRYRAERLLRAYLGLAAKEVIEKRREAEVAELRKRLRELGG